VPDDTDSPRTSRYLIVGAGMTADAAVAGIRAHDPDGAIVVVGAEDVPPYRRPLLSKGLWSGAPESKLWYAATGEGGVELILGRRIVSLDPAEHSAVDDAGHAYRYEQALLATGATPRQIPGTEGVVYFRTLDDYRNVHERAGDGVRAAVIGGGFIGSELAAALNGAGCQVTMIFPDPAIGWRLFPAELAHFVSAYYAEHGIDVLAGETVEAADGGSVTLGSGRRIEADVVVAGLGVIPAVDLAARAGFPVDNGIVVDEYGRVDGDVFAAGDVASFPSLPLGVSMRVEHEDHARSHGRAVGANLAGAGEPYDHLPLFYSDLFDLGYEAVGEVDSRLPQVANWVEPNRQGVVAFCDERSRPRGFLLWNTWDKVDLARELIRGGEAIDARRIAEAFA
jgi:3-phenylpropionate/trans-cinnamate dioxygenase ferredoxin reductase component